MAETIEYHVHYDDGSSITMPFSRRLEMGIWQDTIAGLASQTHPATSRRRKPG